MSIWRSLGGSMLVEIVSASPSDTLGAVSKAGVVLHNVTQTGDLSVIFSVSRGDFQKLTGILERRCDHYKILKKNGFFWSAVGLMNRPVLLIGMLIYMFLMVFLPTRVLFVEVEGNEMVSSQTILSEAENCGIRFGASRRTVRSEKMKNALLGAIPQLQWAGVNTYGCVARISVEERVATPETEKDCNVQSIIASQDGIIREMTVLRGNAVCRVGQAVKAGQLLVSGYTDCGLSIKAEAATAEIYADTIHKLELITPTDMKKKAGMTKEIKKFSLIVGKKLINLFKDSGISDTTCVKMYIKRALVLPGGFSLPVTLIEYRCFDVETTDADAVTDKDFAWMAQYAQKYLLKHMTAGAVRETKLNPHPGEGVYYLQGEYACREMIGQVHKEEIIQGDGKRN